MKKRMSWLAAGPLLLGGSVMVLAAAGQNYLTEGAARWAALQECAQRTATEGDGVVEYGTAVYQTSTGFTYGELQTQNQHTNITITTDPNIGELRSVVHSHPYDAVEGDMSGDRARVPYYAIEQDGDIWRRDPSGGPAVLIYQSPIADPFGT